jgi:hypothetical protein
MVLLSKILQTALLVMALGAVWSLFSRRSSRTPRHPPDSPDSAKRFDASGKDVSDGNFKEIDRKR